MDKITRIHLAKIPYEIGISAQADLKKYLDEIRRELDADLADEIMTDIEVRITEILADRKVKRDDVITTEDIDAVKEQLGSPEQFTDKEAKSQPQSHGYQETRKLFRDTEGAYLAGVASGLGAYFGIDPIFLRILFVILTFVSGLGVVLYILLWLLVPATKTSSDMLQMRGEPVTAAAIQRYRSTAERTIANLKFRSALNLLYRIIRVLFTAGAALFVLALLSAIGFATAALYTQPLRQPYLAYRLNYLLVGLIWLLTITVVGMVMVILLRLWRQGSSPLKIAFATLTGVLVLTLAGISVVSPFIVSHYKNQYGGNKLSVAIPVHNSAPSITPTNLNVLADSNLIVQYVVTTEPMHATYQAYPGMGRPALSIVNQKGTMTISANNLPRVVPDCVLNWCQHVYLPIKLTLYGPALQKFTVNGGAELDLSDIVQTNLTLIAQNNSNLNIDNSYSDNLSLSAESESSISGSDTTAQTASINVQNGSDIFGPATSSLNVTLPANCDQNLLLLAQTPASVTLNGQPVTAQNFSQNTCVGIDTPPPFPGHVLRVKNRTDIPQMPHMPH